LVSVAPDTVCPSCGAAFGVSEVLAARLTALQQRYAHLADGAREVAVTRRQTERRYGRPSTVTTLVLIAGLVLVTALPLYLWSIKVIPNESALGWIITSSMAGLYVFLGGALIWLNRRPRGVLASYQPIVLNGPPTEDAVARAELEADTRERQVRLATAAAERESYERATRVARAGFLHPANLAMLIIVFTLVIVTGTNALLKLGGGLDDYLVLYGVPVAVFGALVLVGWRRRVRRRRYDAALAPLREWLGGPAHTSYADTVGWLNEHWPATTTAADLHVTRGHVSVAGVHSGYPVLVEFEPYGRNDEYATYPPRTLIYVAAHLSGAEPPEADHASIARAGFTVTMEPGAGLLARADDATIARLRGHLSRLDELRPVISDLTALAASRALRVAGGGAAP
jgi:hypothetical protein